MRENFCYADYGDGVTLLVLDTDSLIEWLGSSERENDHHDELARAVALPKGVLHVVINTKQNEAMLVTSLRDPWGDEWLRDGVVSETRLEAALLPWKQFVRAYGRMKSTLVEGV